MQCKTAARLPLTSHRDGRSFKTMSKVTFYTHPMSRGQIVRWALHEVGAEYEAKIVEFGESMKSPDYLRINPMGKVPAIVHDGHVVTECAAICSYLAEAFPQSKLLPTAQERADYYRWIFFAAGVLEPAVSNKSLGIEPPAEKSATLGYGSFDLVIDTLEKKLEADDFACGSRFTMADVYLGAQVDWGLMFKSLPARPSLEAYAKRLSSREPYKAAKAIDAALIAQRQS